MLHPNIWWDNLPERSNTIVIPDAYMLEGYLNKITDNICMDWHDIPWEQKKPQAYFHGCWTGKEFYPDDGGPISKEK